MAQGNFTFVSPSVEFKVTNLSSVEEIAGLTFLGLVGEFEKGPAFQPLEISNKNTLFRILGRQTPERFGGTVKYPATYTANSFLDQSNELTAVRVLGLSGYNAGKAWALTVKGGPTNLVETVVSGDVTETITAVDPIGTANGDIFPQLGGEDIPLNEGLEYTIEPDLVPDSGTTYIGTKYTVTVDDVRIVYVGPDRFYRVDVTYDEIRVTADVNTEYDDRVVAVIRPTGRFLAETRDFLVDQLAITASGDTLNDPFTVTATDTVTATTTEYTFSLDPNRRDFIKNVIGGSNSEKDTVIWCEKAYTSSIAKYIRDSLAYNVAELVELDNFNFSDYNEQYRGAETPWVVSELRGSEIERLFKVYTIGDGNSANSEIKVSIENIDPDRREFDVVVRDFGDTDSRPVVLESFRRCSMDESLSSFVGRRIGSVDLANGQYIYDRQSDYIYIVVSETAPRDAFPAGFEGYPVRSYLSGITDYTKDLKDPQIFYKTQYEDGEQVAKAYLGISEKAYTESIAGTISFGINQDFFDYFGIETPDNTAKTKGFHMDSDTAGNVYSSSSQTIGEFEAGPDVFKDLSDISDPLNAYNDPRTRKFTFVPAGGWDGWDIHRSFRTNTDAYSEGSTNYSDTNDWVAYSNAIDKISNPEEVEMNLLATPNINFFDHLTLVNKTLDIVETRGDTLYVIDPPDITGADLAENISELFRLSGVDSFYSATYSPWTEILDGQNNVPVYLPPSTQIMTIFALTDNIAFPWFATAGENRGQLPNVRRTRKKLSKSERDIMYAARVNPIKDEKSGVVTIFGQKTTQETPNALDRINVVRLILTARKTISNIAKSLLFDPNDEIVRSQFETRVNAYLSRVKRERGLTDFQIVGDGLDPATLDRNEMLYKLLIKPTRALEYIGVEFVVTDTGASFSDIIQTA